LSYLLEPTRGRGAVSGNAKGDTQIEHPTLATAAKAPPAPAVADDVKARRTLAVQWARKETALVRRFESRSEKNIADSNAFND
jgi:hypothetical protein